MLLITTFKAKLWNYEGVWNNDVLTYLTGRTQDNQRSTDFLWCLLSWKIPHLLRLFWWGDLCMISVIQNIKIHLNKVHNKCSVRFVSPKETQMYVIDRIPQSQFQDQYFFSNIHYCNNWKNFNIIKIISLAKQT